MLGMCCAALGAVGEPPRGLSGLPFTRHYSFDQIGDITRSGQLTFDKGGRLVAVRDQAYVVLNDDTWLDIGAREPDAVKVLQVAHDADGTSYYGALGSWGILVLGDDGRMRAQPLSPANPPPWVLANNFTDILCRPEGVYLAGWNGLVFWDRRTREHRYFEVPAIVRVFSLGERVYISSHIRGLLAFANDALVEDRTLGNTVVGNVAALGDGRAFVSDTYRRLFLYDGNRLISLPGPLGKSLRGSVSALQTLPEGNVAVAIAGEGLYIVSPNGEIVWALTRPEYRAISKLAINEPGVLWALAETGVIKTLYGAPVSLFDQSLGISVSWPQIVRWNDDVVIASKGRLYERTPGATGEPARFRLMPGQSPAGAWGIAVQGEWLLAANASAVFARRSGEPFRPVLSGSDIARLVTLESGVCLVIGQSEIAALRCEAGTWTECAPRIAGAGYPAIVHAAKKSAWIEIGADRAARVTFADGQLQARTFDSFPWKQQRWINVSVVDNIVVLAGPKLGRLFFDEDTGQFCEPRALQAALDQAPYWVARVHPGEDGTLWASHEHGVFTLTPKAGGYAADTARFRIVHEHLPLVQKVPGHGTWISTGDSLYHVEGRPREAPAPAFRPRLVSARDLRTRREYLLDSNLPRFPESIRYAQNSIAFRFFAGSYFSRRPPSYEYRINQNDWSSLETTSLLRLSDLREGRYRIDVRLVDDRGPLGSPTSLDFEIAPPWYRTWYSLAGYVLASVLAVLSVIRLSLHRARARNATLEKTVAERTAELAAAMQKLQHETQVAATLAERNRLAGEIHDSLEQGFSGLLLQLETTAGLAACPPVVQNALTVARNMVAFSRNEVRHAVWDLHSPMLDAGGLEAALKNLIAQLAPEPTRPAVIVQGPARALGSTIEHHLLRIAQEAIANAVKHAAATRLEVGLTFTEEEVRLRISDDGRGFDSGSVLAIGKGHFGLRSLRGRAAKIGGAVTIESSPGAGTRITVHVPMPKPDI